ncbi:hypothetical protein Lbir_1849, partial [Legionella birminghamensis]
RGCSDERFGPALNKFFTSSTRATGALIIDQDEGHPLTWLCKALKEGINTPKSAFLRELLSEQTAEEQLAGWELEVCRLYREGKKEWSQHAFHRWIEGKLPYADYESFLLAHELIKKEMPLAEEKQEKEATPEIEPPAGEATEPQAALPEPAKEEAAGSRRNRKKKAKRKASQSAQKAQLSITASLSLKPPQTMDQTSPFPSSNALVRSPATFFANRGVKRNLGLPGTVADLEASLNTVKLSKIATSGELVKTCDAIIAQGTDLEKKWAEIQKEKEQAKTALLPGDLKVQRFLNELFNNFSKQYLDKIFKRVPPYKPETILKWFVLTENQGYDCFLSRLKFDKGNLKPNEDKWLALQHYEGLNSYFSLQELTRTEPASGKTYFEILCRKQCGLNFLNSIWASMSIPETVHSGALAQLWTTFYAASSTNAWDDLDDKENLLIYLINYPGGLAVFETLFSSSLFATLRWMDKEKNTLLHWAVSDQRKDLVKSIMRARAAALGGGYLKPEFDVLGIKNSQNLTAFELAKKNNSSKIIDALNPSNYEKSSGTNTPPFHDEEYITVAIQEIAKTRGSIQIPAIKKIVNETNALRHDQKVCRDKLSLNPRNKELRKKLKLVETVIDERMSQHNELEREIRVNALFQLTKANLGSKAMYEQLDLLVVGTPPDLLFTCLTASITPKLPPLLYCLFTTSLWSDDREGPWGSFLKYMEDNPVLVNFNFSLKQLFKVDKNSVKSRFETLVRSREGLVFLHAIFKMLSISDTVGEELHAGIITHLYPDITARPWGDLSEADTLLIYLINRSEGREILAKFPPNMFFNMIAQQDAQWNSFLHWAVISQRADLISMVLKLEQRLSDKTALPRYLGLKNEAGQTALDIAKENNFKLGIDLLSVKANEISKHKAAETSFENLPVSVNPF